MSEAGNAEGEIGRMQHEKRVALPNEHSATRRDNQECSRCMIGLVKIRFII